MTTDTHSDAFGQRLMALFEAVIELDAAAREARIAEVADTEPALADAVRALLARDAETGALRAHLSAEVEPLLREALPSLASDPQTIGPYAVLRRLGEGGMGRVYLARRSDSPVAQNVAIKLIRSDRVSPGLLDRFEAERRHLAALDHPGICRFIDAASLADGTPYVVMEAVEGVPIIEYCAQRELGVDARLKLLRKLLAAVAHAHDRLLVHRDIKPHNVLVTNDGEPKLLDFGIAKSIEAEHASQTRTAERFFTPNASAPEQLLGGAFGVGCDVYALGALAYELLSGHLPFDFDGLRAAEIERLILQVAPPLMSERAPTARARELRGDLDAIVATCLRKSPAERYANVSALDNDLARYLEGRPVEARAPSWIYRATLFVRRHRVSVALSGALTLAILGSAATLAVQAFELREQRNLAVIERDRALQVVEILENAFRNADPGQSEGDTITARQILDAAKPGIEELESTQPQVFARMAATLANVELELGQWTRAADWVDRGATAIEGDEASSTILHSLLLTGAIAHARNANAPRARAIIEQLESSGFSEEPLFLFAKARVMTLHPEQRREGIALLERLIPMAAANDPQDLLANRTRWLLIQSLLDSKQLTRAAEVADATLDWQNDGLKQGHPWILETRIRRLAVASASGESDAAVDQYPSLISSVESTFGPRSPKAAMVRNSFSLALSRANRPDAAMQQARVALELFRESRGAKHISSIRAGLSLGILLLYTGSSKDLPEAEEMFRTTSLDSIELLGLSAPLSMNIHNGLIESLTRQEKWQDALTELAQSPQFSGNALRAALNRKARLGYIDQILRSSACAESKNEEQSLCRSIERMKTLLELSNHSPSQ
ncbi:protein kinase [Aquimonas sp.]|jgi:serine/threonine-protein kinase|uniref:serine/threonine protein kinase n=1 Tax=Aquimonas sp. TaxID=1872588 RepID=UPI0037BFB384